ncbi:transcription initiation factor TFIID, variant 2 [Chamberlinius hualienensis]
MANGSNAFENPGVPIVRAQWLSVEGVQKPISPSTAGKKNSAVIPSVSSELMVYYNQVTKAILGNSEQITKTALEDLQSNPRIAALLPYLVNFVSVGVKKVSHDLSQLTKLLHTVRSVINNPYLYLGPRPILKLLVQSVLYCIVEPCLNPIGDHWALRDYAARLLAHIIRIWHTPINQQHEHTLVVLKDVFIDLTKPFCSHYGAVTAISGLGVEPIWKYLYPHLVNYWPHLTATLDGQNLAAKADAQKVYGALLLASERLVLHLHGNILRLDERGVDTNVKSDSKVRIEESSRSTTSKFSSEKEAYKCLYEYFGDALAARLPNFKVENFYVPRKPQLINLLSTPERMLTGEELLESFNVKEEEAQSNSFEDDHYSYDDNSLMSDDGEPEEPTANVDLRIKSTVSDPIQGIKLTITKLPRTQPPPPPIETTKVTKLNIKILPDVQPEAQPLVSQTPPQVSIVPPVQEEKDGPFEVVNIKPPNRYIEFNFDGSMPKPSNELRRKYPFHCIPFSSGTRAVSIRMKPIGKCKSITRRYSAMYNKCKRSFHSGNILLSV